MTPLGQGLMALGDGMGSWAASRVGGGPRGSCTGTVRAVGSLRTLAV